MIQFPLQNFVMINDSQAVNFHSQISPQPLDESLDVFIEGDKNSLKTTCALVSRHVSMK